MSEVGLVKCMNCGRVLDHDSYCESCYSSVEESKYDEGYENGFDEAILEVERVITGMVIEDLNLKKKILREIKRIR